jgi:hypothetical protein
MEGTLEYFDTHQWKEAGEATLFCPVCKVYYMRVKMRGGEIWEGYEEEVNNKRNLVRPFKCTRRVMEEALE